MVEIIVFAIFVVSFAGVLFIVARKMPAAKRISEESGDFRLSNSFTGVKKWLAVKIKSAPYLRDFSWIDFLQKMLLKGRLIVLKAENKITDYMIKLRKRAEDQRQKDAPLDNYWHDLKSIVKTKQSSSKDGQAADIDSSSIIDTVKAVPENIIQKFSHHKKKNSHKKKRFRDPFKW